MKPLARSPQTCRRLQTSEHVTKNGQNRAQSVAMARKIFFALVAGLVAVAAQDITTFGNISLPCVLGGASSSYQQAESQMQADMDACQTGCDPTVPASCM